MVNRLPVFTLPILLLLVLGSGCTMFPAAPTETTPPLPPTQAFNPQTPPPNQPMILVEIQAPKKQSETKQIPLASAPTLQAAVDQVNATSKFKRFHIAVSRLPQHQGGEAQKLISQYDHQEKRIPFEYDYQLHPGDRIVIIEDSSSFVEDMFGGAINPIRGMAGLPPTNGSPF